MKSVNTINKITEHYPKILTLSALVALVASFWQATERIHMLKNPDAILNCNINPVVDCGAVLGNKLAAVFGPPNAFIGIVMFTMLFAFGLQRMSGGQWSQLVAKAVVALSAIAVLFSAWFFAVSLYSIGKICIFCIFIWIASMAIGVYGFIDYFSNSRIKNDRLKSVLKLAQNNHATILLAIYGTMLILFLYRFRDYYFS